MPYSMQPPDDQPDDELKQIQPEAVAPYPLLPITVPVPAPTQSSIDEQQAYLIRTLDGLNAQVDDLLQDRPSLSAVYQEQLALFFPELPLPINPNQIFYSRYHDDEQGQQQLLSCVPLGSLLQQLSAPEGTAYLEQRGAFYGVRDSLAITNRIAHTGSLATLASGLEIAIILRLNAFWMARESTQPSTEERLVALRRQVLAHQLALRTVDGTLSAAGRTLADNLLKYPEASLRQKAFAASDRPVVYRLTLEDGSDFAAAFILYASDAAAPAGRVMLYTPGEEFEEFENLARLNDAVAARLRDNGPAATLLRASLPGHARAQLSGLPVLAAQPPRLDADVIADSVRSLRIRQYFNVREALRKDVLPVAGELDQAADLTPHLDACTALAARNLRLIETREPHWLPIASPTSQARYRQLERAQLESNAVLIPLLKQISAFSAFSENETHRVLKQQKPEYAEVVIDPYKSLVHLRLSASNAVEVTGFRNEATRTVFISEDPRINLPKVLAGQQLVPGTWQTKMVVDVRTLGSYARRNVDPWSAHELHRTISATAEIIDTSGANRGSLGDDDLRALAQRADIGAAYAAYLRSAFAQDGEASGFADAWQRAHATKMRKDALEARLNPAVYDLFTFKTPGSGFDWINAITEHPDSATRPRVGGFDIEANLLVLGSALQGGQGGQVINGALVIQRTGTRSDGVSVLYTPDSPDNVPFRELVNGLSELDTLKAKPEWRAYLTRRMATRDANELSRLFSDTRSTYRYALTPVTGNVHAFMYSAQLGFQLALADYGSRSNQEISRESAVNAFMFGAGVIDCLMDLVPAKASLALLRRGIQRSLHSAQVLGRRIPGLVKKINVPRTGGIAIGMSSIQPLEPAWLNVAPYRLPSQIDAQFDVDLFAQANNFRLSRATGRAPYFTDHRNHSLIAMKDEAGRHHLYSSYTRDGARYVKDPSGTRSDFMVVSGDAKTWKPRFERSAIGGGAVWSALRPLTAEALIDSDLRMALQRYATASEKRFFERAIDQLSTAQKKRLLDDARNRMGLNEAEFRQRMSDPRPLNQNARGALLELRIDTDIFLHMYSSADVLEPALSLLEMDQLFKKIKKIVGKNEHFSKHVQASITIRDPKTGTQLVGYAVSTQQVNSLSRFQRTFEFMTSPTESLNAFLGEKGRLQILNKIASDNNLTREKALELLFASPSIKEALRTFKTDYLLKKLDAMGVESYAQEFKKQGVPYIALSRDLPVGGDARLKMVDSRTVTNFEKNISQFSSPLEFAPTRAQTHRTQKPIPAAESPLPRPTAAKEPGNIVRFDELAETQIPLLPDIARNKLSEIIQDIQAGRVTRKKIGQHNYVDLPQVESGSGRGRWRAAFERGTKEGEQEVFILKGIIDYHGGKWVAWRV